MNHGENAMSVRNPVTPLLGLFAVCGIAMHAAAAASETDTLETITVSARKRDESLATVPVSITVFTGETLQNYNIQSFTDYATKTPNVSFSYGGGGRHHGVSEPYRYVRPRQSRGHGLRRAGGRVSRNRTDRCHRGRSNRRSRP
jgi:outer membrane receptor protein involved in Fe transport